MTKICKKFISIYLALMLLFYSAGFPILARAQVADPTPTVDQTSPTPTVDQTSPTPSTDSPTPTPDQISQTDQTSPTPSTDSPTPTPGTENTATVDNTVGSDANSGTNTTSSDTQSSAKDDAGITSTSPSASSSAATGDSTAVTTVENDVNSTSLNSNVILQTINIFVGQNGSLNLSDPYSLASQAILDHPQDPVINLSVVNVSNFAYVTNTVVSNANTGGNTVNGGSGDTSLTTGNAYSAVSLLNKVNFTVVNSVIHIVTINVFGSLNGNIILPEGSVSPCTDCQGAGSSINNAQVNNNVDSTSNTGKNTVTGANASATTGDAKSIVNILNFINSYIVNSDIQSLYINVGGGWDGDFLGWYKYDPVTGNRTLVFANVTQNGATCDSCGSSNSLNTAYVNNNVTSMANSGNNTVNGNGTLTTGNAYSAVSIFNFVNTSFINSYGFFGFLNIFGNWHGNIGGTKEFADNAPVQEAASTQATPQQDKGGILTVDSSNNVGDHVNPGDTVTFFVNTKNTGTGTVYGAKLWLHLIKDGKDAGGTEFDLGDIAGGKSLHLSTGFVLTKNLAGGPYIARAVVSGKVGPNNDDVSASSENTFNVFTAIAKALGTSDVLVASANDEKTKKKSYILPASTEGNAHAYDNIWLLIIAASSYVALRSVREKKRLNTNVKKISTTH